MNKPKVLTLLLLVIGLTLIGAAAIFASAAKPAITIRKMEPQVVLYTIYRGSYEKTGSAIGKLFALAGQNRIQPQGPIYYVYLNNPNQVSSEHWLTEIRIPVGKDALKIAGTLGEMTDVKTLPAMEMAVAVKPQGLADPSPIYTALYTWATKQGYMVSGSPREVFLTNAMSGNYAQMKTEIMLGVQKFTSNKD